MMAHLTITASATNSQEVPVGRIVVDSGECVDTLFEILMATFPAWRDRGVFLMCGGVVLDMGHRTLSSYGITGGATVTLFSLTGGLPAAEVAAAEADVRGGVASLTSPAASVSRVTTLEGATHDVVHTLDGAAAAGLRSDSLHGLLLRLSPGYGAWFFGKVAAALARD